jgi:hypothetical protein
MEFWRKFRYHTSKTSGRDLTSLARPHSTMVKSIGKDIYAPPICFTIKLNDDYFTDLQLLHVLSI